MVRGYGGSPSWPAPEARRRLTPGPALGCLAALIVPVIAAVAIWLAPIPFGDDGSGGDPWTFAETLSRVTEDLAADTRVLSVRAGGGSVTYELVSADRAVQTRRYFVEIEDIRFPGPDGGLRDAEARTRRIEDSRRGASPREVRAATVILSELDSRVVEEMCEGVGLAARDCSAELSGRRWTLASRARPFERYVAHVDGTGLRPVPADEDSAGAGP